VSENPTTPEAAEAVSPDVAARLRAFGALRAIRDHYDDLLKQVEADIKAERIDHFVATGSKVTNLTLPDGTKFGTIVVRESSDEPYVADGAAFLSWVDDQTELRANIETVERVRPTFQKHLLTELVTWVDDPTWTADPDGPEDQRPPLVALYGDEIVPGIAVRRAPKRPTSAAAQFEKPTKAKGKVKTEANQLDGRDRILGFIAEQAKQGRGIESLLGETGLIDAGPQVLATS